MIQDNVKLRRENLLSANSALIASEFDVNLESEYQPTSDYLAVVKDGQIVKNGIYYEVVYQTEDLPEQGWKIHVAAIPGNAKRTLEICSEICSRDKINYKFVCDPQLFILQNSKNWPRHESGKFITIYPKSTEQFKRVLRELYPIMKSFKGPYILSDRRYRKNCRVLYYRYGGFKHRTMLDASGKLQPAILDPNGKKVIDVRRAYYYQPNWVKDPFTHRNERKDVPDEEITLHHGRYTIKKVLHYTNSGGLYVAADNFAARTVILKEARPATQMNTANDEDAVSIRQREWQLLKRLDKQKNLNIPMPIELFKQWENYFLVEGLIEGQDLQSFITENNPLTFSGSYSNTTARLEQLKRYLQQIKQIAINLLTALAVMHHNKVYLGELSTADLMIDDKFELYLLDLKDGGYLDQPSGVSNSTPEFGGQAEKSDQARVDHDYFVVGAVLVNSLLPINDGLSIDRGIVKKFMAALQRDYQLPASFMAVIESLLDHPEKVNLPELTAQLSQTSFADVQFHDHELQPQAAAVALELKQMNAYLGKHVDYQTLAVLIPGDCQRHNSLNVANGLAGLVHYQTKNGLVRDDRAVTTLGQNADQVTEVGLYDGLAGIAWVLLECGQTADSIQVLERVSATLKRKTNDFSLRSGLAGIGLTYLYFYTQTKQEQYLQYAGEVKDKLLAAMSMTVETVFWRDGQDQIPCGLAAGGSGIALFLLKLADLTDDAFLLAIAEKALNFELTKVISTDQAVVLRRSATAKTGASDLFSGTAGLVAVLLRFYQVEQTKQSTHATQTKQGTQTKQNIRTTRVAQVTRITQATQVANKQKLADLLDFLADDLARKYLVTVGYGAGAAGIGMVLLDAYQIIGDDKYLRAAWRIYQGLQRFKIQKEDGIAYPGRSLLQISNDFLTGELGVAAFYQRLVKNTGHDFFLDDLAQEAKGHE
ncbi:protein kinase/lanthionine synthetase C family protein [Lapidilactobacillus luobeiensis]|uniref:protein kinase/lanthionine synthetase C family protein n=1 Tax=Lapidilactobacillus luobeiensis TaxID=2950371 RepID=UPI0021C28866|nr:protein kinase/lanthionine synthetase C family protein [Lapidilactobacillus luobeiensis]